MSERVKMESKPLSGFFLTQYLDSEYWDWTDDEKKSLGDLKSMLEIILDRLNNEGAPFDTEVVEILGIFHDKDVQRIWDEKVQDYVLDAKLNHIHVYVRLNKRMRLLSIADAIGVAPQYIEAPKKGRYGTSNILAYLIHAKDSDKYQYSPSEVETLGTFDYLDYYSKNKLAWEEGRSTKAKKRNATKIDWLVDQVVQGRLSKEQLMLTDEYAEVYSRNMREINDAFDFYAERKAFQNIEALKNGEFELTVYFLVGKSGAGKTHAAIDFTKRLIKNRFEQTGERWRTVQGGSTNPMDNYQGEEILMLDDLRGFSMTASDWLKLLDPILVSPVGARYKNKIPASRVIIITSSRDPLEYFYYLKGNASSNKNEAMDQFFRRLTGVIRIIKTDDDNREIEFSRIYELDAPVSHSFKDDKGYIISTELSFVPENAERFDYDSGIDAMVDNVAKANNPSRTDKVNVPKSFKKAKAKEQLRAFGYEVSDSE